MAPIEHAGAVPEQVIQVTLSNYMAIVERAKKAEAERDANSELASEYAFIILRLEKQITNMERKLAEKSL